MKPTVVHAPKLWDCPLCGRGKFSARGLALHACPQLPVMWHGRHDRLEVTLCQAVVHSDVEMIFTAIADLARRGHRPVPRMAKRWAKAHRLFHSAISHQPSAIR